MQRDVHVLGAACLVAITLGGCGAPLGGEMSARSTDRPTAFPTASPSPASPTVAPLASPSAAPDDDIGLESDTVARVVTNDLVVRSAPGLGDDSEILPERLNAMVGSLPPEPQLLYVVDGPVIADGYDWYLVKAFLPRYCADVCPEPPFGWVAAGSGDGEAWIAPHTLDCPDPTIENLMWLSAVAQLACFDTQTLVLEGDAGDCSLAERSEASFQEACYLHPPDFEETVEGGIGPRFVNVFVAEVEWPQPGSRVTITGRFDHPAAVQCQGMSDEAAREFGIDPATLPPPALANLTCRTAFFATGVEAARP